jgi:hypothetical protein
LDPTFQARSGPVTIKRGDDGGENRDTLQRGGDWRIQFTGGKASSGVLPQEDTDEKTRVVKKLKVARDRKSKPPAHVWKPRDPRGSVSEGEDARGDGAYQAPRSQAI